MPCRKTCSTVPRCPMGEEFFVPHQRINAGSQMAFTVAHEIIARGFQIEEFDERVTGRDGAEAPLYADRQVPAPL